MNINRLLTEQTVEDLMHNEAVIDSGLYRGVTHQVDGIVKMPIRTDRKPRNTFVSASVLFNVAFQEKFGVADVRKQSAFCTTNFDVANEYSFGDDGKGSVVEVHPLKSATIAYNPAISDSMRLCDKFAHTFGRLDKTTDHIVALLDEADYSLPSSQLFANAVNEAGGTQEHIDHLKQVGEQLLVGYQVGPAKPITNVNDAEVMLFNSAYYYASAVEDENGDYFD